MRRPAGNGPVVGFQSGTVNVPQQLRPRHHGDILPIPTTRQPRVVEPLDSTSRCPFCFGAGLLRPQPVEEVRRPLHRDGKVIPLLRGEGVGEQMMPCGALVAVFVQHLGDLGSAAGQNAPRYRQLKRFTRSARRLNLASTCPRPWNDRRRPIRSTSVASRSPSMSPTATMANHRSKWRQSAPCRLFCGHRIRPRSHHTHHGVHRAVMGDISTPNVGLAQQRSSPQSDPPTTPRRRH